MPTDVIPPSLTTLRTEAHAFLERRHDLLERLVAQRKEIEILIDQLGGEAALKRPVPVRIPGVPESMMTEALTRRPLSESTRKAMSLAQKARWAKTRKKR